MAKDKQASADTLPWADRLSIRQRLVWAVAFILVLFGLSCAVSFGAFENVQDARELSSRVTSTLAHTAELDDAIARSESALRAYVLTGAPRFKATIDAKRMQFEEAIEVLLGNSDLSSVQRRRLNQIEERARQWQSTVVAPVIEQVRNGDLEAARQRLIGGEGVALTDPLRGAVDRFRAQVQSELDASIVVIDYRQQRARWLLLAVLIFGLLTGLFTVRAIVRRVTRPLSELSRMTTRLAGGERDIEIQFREREDEIGAVANALEKFRQIILEQDRQAWIRDHRARLMVALQKCKSETELGKRLLEEVAPLLGAGYGALFAPATLHGEDEQFSLLASYGYSGEIRQSFAPGEGLVGQVIASGERIVINEVPDGYLNVRSGLGESSPAVLLLAPAIAGQSVVGVLEIALMRRPDPSDMELLETLLPNVALALVTLARTRRAVELLEQSRAQTEALKESEQRLRDRQEELKNANSELRMQSEELNAQSEELRASEEELKVQSDALQATNEELRQRQELMREQQEELTRLHAETERRAEALAQTSQYKSDFLANMSHELRTPLNSLLILSRSLADNSQGHLDSEEAEAASIIHESGSNLLSLINDILDLSKIEAGKMAVNPESTRVDGVVQRIERDFAHVAQDKGLVFEVHVGAGVPETLVTDSGKLDQVIRNLVSNAIKFTEQGKVRVEIVTPDPNMTFQTPGLTAENALAIHVVDEGIGIPKNRMEQIFKAFEQVDASTSRTYGGTGLGLSISLELSRLLGGKIMVESELGVGSRFTIYIRRVLDPKIKVRTGLTTQAETRRIDDARPPLRAPRQNGASESDESAAALHVLIIDDDATFSRVVAEAARRRGFECSTAADGERGLAMVRQQLPDAIVLDLGLPGMDGWAVLDRLKASDRTREIPVHIVSAADDTGRSRQAGAVGYLRKPISKGDLDTLFARAETLSGREARRVLVVDDDRDAHTAITHLLKREQVEITAVVSGAAALTKLDAEDFDCVVLDLSLPDISGFELIEQIAERDNAPPVVVYSARELSEEETRSLRAHTDSIVIKGARAQERLLDEVSLFFHQLSDRSATARKARPAEPAFSQELPKLTGHTALLVDDDMRNTFALSRVLRERGLKVLMASDGFKALDQLQANEQVSIVLMDIMMPGMDGYEAIRRIRAQAQYRDLPIVALTAKAMPGDREKCLEAGATEYLPKPVDTAALLDLMTGLL